MVSETSCTNCNKVVPDGAKLCPNCGAGVIPLPTLDGDKRAAGAGATQFRTGTRGGDVAAGIALGVFLPALLAGIAFAPLFGFLGLFGSLLLLMIPITIGVPIFVANRIKRKYFVFGDAMQKTLWGWLILFGLSFLGLLAVCFSGAIKI